MECLSSKMEEDDRKTTRDGNNCKSQADTIKIQDQILLRKAIEDRNKEAIRQLNTIYYPNVKRYIASRVDGIEDVEDLSQSVFLEFYKKDDDTYKKYQSAEAYLLKIAQNLIALHYRNQNKQPNTISIESIGEIADSDTVQHHQNIPRGISLRELTKIFETVELPPKARQTLNFKFVKRYSTQKAAQKAGCSVWTFYKRVDKAMELLEDMVKRRY